MPLAGAAAAARNRRALSGAGDRGQHLRAPALARQRAAVAQDRSTRTGNVIQIDSFSKIAFPGLRVGWCIGAESAIERLRLVKQSTDLHTDQLSQAALAEFIRRGYLARHLAKMKKVYRSRLEAMEEALEKHMPEGTTWTRPEGGMSVWVTLPPGFDAGELLIHARERGILFVSRAATFIRSSPQPNTLRLGFASRGRKAYRARHRRFWRLLKQEIAQAAARRARSKSAARRGAGSEAHAAEHGIGGMMLLEPNPDECTAFGCGGANARGMQLTFEQDDAARRIRGAFRIGAEYQGGPGFVHGGIIATLLDEVMAQGEPVRQGSRGHRGAHGRISEAGAGGRRLDREGWEVGTRRAQSSYAQGEIRDRVGRAAGARQRAVRGD